MFSSYNLITLTQNASLTVKRSWTLVKLNKGAVINNSASLPSKPGIPSFINCIFRDLIHALYVVWLLCKLYTCIKDLIHTM